MTCTEILKIANSHLLNSDLFSVYPDLKCFVVDANRIDGLSAEMTVVVPKAWLFETIKSEHVGFSDNDCQDFLENHYTYDGVVWYQKALQQNQIISVLIHS